jgi:hypothetical protein
MMKILFAVCFLFSISSFAAISTQTKNSLKNAPMLRGSGAIHGGLAGKGFSLLGIQSQVAKNKKLERLTVAMGDSNFQPYQGSPGYFHIENTLNSKRVVINFSQTLVSKFDEKGLQRAFAQSPFVKTSQMVFDPQTQTTSLILQMKKQASVRVIPVNGLGKQVAQLKIDFFEDAKLNRNKK